MNITTHRIESITRLNNSVNGNPRFRFYLTADGAEYGEAVISSSDAAFCYAVGNPGMREGDLVVVERTRAGRITRMDPAPTGPNFIQPCECGRHIFPPCSEQAAS